MKTVPGVLLYRAETADQHIVVWCEFV